jgi:hypothetical protein
MNNKINKILVFLLLLFQRYFVENVSFPVDMGCWYMRVCMYYLNLKYTSATGVNLEKLVCSLFRKHILIRARLYILLYSHTLRGCPCPEHDKSVHSLLAYVPKKLLQTYHKTTNTHAQIYIYQLV